jgi:acyl-[acyl-carrier-protein]-phospholipid O-acyltransferase/long-chain-fatty-acid--[acyl-carrier-protein] ligase
LGLSLFTAAFVWLQSWVDVDQFAILSPIGFGLCFCLFGVAFTGGLFSTPLYAGLQAWSDPEHRSRNVAANNIMNSVFIVTASGVVAILAVLGFDWAGRLLILAGLNVLASLYIISLVPEGVVQTVGRMILRILFRVKVQGLEHYAAARPRKVIIANHVSYLDAVILSAFLPEIPTFAIDTRIARVWWIRPALTFIRAFPLDTAKPMAIKSLTKLVQQGTPVVIFPEGRLTMTGGLMKMYQGPGTMALHGDADIVPVWLDGVQYSLVSQLKDKKRLSWFPKIIMTIMPPVRLEKPAGTGRAGRAQVVNKIYGLMTEMSYRATPIRTTLFSALIEAGRKHGPTREAVNDPKFHPLTYRQLIARARTLATKLEARMTGNDPVGLLLPNSVAGVTALFALQAAGRVTAMLNYSIGAKNLRSACTTARIRHVWTSEEFVRVAKLQPLVEVLEMDGVKVHYLESQQKERTCWDVARYLVYSSFPKWGLPQPHELEVQSLQPAVILFTSGSSGTPKAVVLSHHNLLANQAQLLARIDFNAQDRVFNCLPVFHSFGLTGGTLAPLFAGVRVFLYPSPLHYGMIPEMVYQTSCTILFGTNTFLSGYSRKAHPYDFYSVRYVFAGAEKIRENTKRVWAETFGIRILEGYGSTECSPVIATNTPMYNQSGTVGQFLPGLEWRLEPVSGINSGGRLWVKGENIMLGYYLPENPGVLQSPHDGWYDTGDIVEVTNEGFVRILGRAKRFAKVAGEMVSLTAVEELATQTCPGSLHVAVAVANEGKGEEIILVTESESLTRAEVLASAQSQGISALAVPSKIVPGRVPLLASGKPDYVAVQEWVTKRTAIA